MAINFASKANRYTYSDREADRGWADAIRAIVDPSGKDVVDIGCGGGIYSTAFSDLGAASVIGVDSSAEMIGSARKRAVGHDTVTFRIGNAASTELAAGAADIVFARPRASSRRPRSLLPRGETTAPTFGNARCPGSVVGRRGRARIAGSHPRLLFREVSSPPRRRA